MKKYVLVHVKVNFSLLFEQSCTKTLHNRLLLFFTQKDFKHTSNIPISQKKTVVYDWKKK